MNRRPTAYEGVEGPRNNTHLRSRPGRSRQAAASSGVYGVARATDGAMRRLNSLGRSILCVYRFLAPPGFGGRLERLIKLSRRLGSDSRRKSGTSDSATPRHRSSARREPEASTRGMVPPSPSSQARLQPSAHHCIVSNERSHAHPPQKKISRQPHLCRTSNVASRLLDQQSIRSNTTQTVYSSTVSPFGWC